MSARITVVGLHGDAGPPAELLAEAALVVGGKEQLARLPPGGPPQQPLRGDLQQALTAIERADGPVLVLASGDPGFFGIVRRLAAELGSARLDVRPAPSSVAHAFARLGLPWDDALVVSAHGRDLHRATNTALRHPKVAILTGPDGAEQLVTALASPDRDVVVLERLGHRDERVGGLPPYAEPNVVVSLARGGQERTRATTSPPRTTPRGWALADEAFEHRAGMVTKAEVRALALARLGPGLGDLVWDVGCGSGSVGIECARLGAALIAIDPDPRAIALTTENAQAHGVPVQTVHGAAPAALHALPDPDAVFVGGGGDDLEAIVELAAARARRAVVVTLATVERVSPVLRALQQAGLDAEGTQLQASRIKPLGQGHRLDAQNPVFVLSGARRP